MAYGRSTGFKVGGAGKHGFSLKSDMNMGAKSGQKRPFGKGAGKGMAGSLMGKSKARKQARAKV